MHLLCWLGWHKWGEWELLREYKAGGITYSRRYKRECRYCSKFQILREELALPNSKYYPSATHFKEVS